MLLAGGVFMIGTVVVLGGSGGVGRGIVRELLAAGYGVVAVGRSEAHLASLADAIGNSNDLTTLRGSVATDEEAVKLVADLKALGRSPLAVVASISGEIAGARLLEQPGRFLQRTLEDDVVSHFIAARHLLPMLAESERESLYLLLSGPAAECTWAGYGHLSIAASALRMLTLVVREEAKDLPVQVRQLQICTPVRTGRFGDCECPEWLAPEDVGREVVGLIKDGNMGEAVVRIGGYPGRVESRHAETTMGSRNSTPASHDRTMVDDEGYTSVGTDTRQTEGRGG